MIRDRIVELRRVPARDLRANPKNWRRHPDSQAKALRSLLAEVGYADALLARETPQGLVLIDGHLRAETTPDTTVPVLVLDVSEDEADLILTTLDPLASMAEADATKLEELLATVRIPDVELRHRIEFLAGLSRKGRTDPDDVPDLPAKPKTRPGDLWQLGEHRLLCGDATSTEDLARLMDGEQADVLWTDPPYGVAYVGGNHMDSREVRLAKGGLTLNGDGQEGLDALLEDAFAAIDTVLVPGAAIYIAHPAGAMSVTFGVRFLAQGWRLHQTLVWVKDSMVLGHADYHYRHEPILYGYTAGRGRRGRGGRGWYGGNARDTVFEVPRPKASPEHPTAKPVALVELCLENSSRPDALVLDAFAGSGTTVIACESLDRRARALEIDPRYVDVTVRRWEAFTGEQAVRI